LTNPIRIRSLRRGLQVSSGKVEMKTEFGIQQKKSVLLGVTKSLSPILPPLIIFIGSTNHVSNHPFRLSVNISLQGMKKIMRSGTTP
jgi:hypothetical protein